MKNSAAFLKAYKLVFTGAEQYSCDAILRASSGRAPGALLFYRALFTPSVDSPEHYWLRNQKMTYVESYEWRITALAFAAAIANAEEKEHAL